MLPDPLKLTAKELIKLRITTAEELSAHTKRQRAVESKYLNDLVKMNYCRKIRIGRKIYFYTGPLSNLNVFQTLEKDFRLLLLVILRLIPSYQKKANFSIETILNQFNMLNQDQETSEKDFLKSINLASVKLDFIDIKVSEDNKITNIIYDLEKTLVS